MVATTMRTLFFNVIITFISMTVKMLCKEFVIVTAPHPCRLIQNSFVIVEWPRDFQWSSIDDFYPFMTIPFAWPMCLLLPPFFFLVPLSLETNRIASGQMFLIVRFAISRNGWEKKMQIQMAENKRNTYGYIIKLKLRIRTTFEAKLNHLRKSIHAKAFSVEFIWMAFVLTIEASECSSHSNNGKKELSSFPNFRLKLTSSDRCWSMHHFW